MIKSIEAKHSISQVENQVKTIIPNKILDIENNVIQDVLKTVDEAKLHNFKIHKL
jgi:hypothetical protein